MNLMKDKKGFVDQEIIMSPGFIILALLAVSATVIGWSLSRSWDVDAFPVWQLMIILAGELVACYVITVKMLS